MDEDTIKSLRTQHRNNYKQAVLENIKNNTIVLVDEDIMSLLRKPPLDSMDLIRAKFLDLAKKNKIVLNIVVLDEVLESYRINLFCCCQQIKDLRIEELSSTLMKIKLEKSNDVIVFYKKDFISVNKDIKKIIKQQLVLSFEEKIFNKMDKILENVELSIKEKITEDISKYIRGIYQKQLLENLDIKLMVKDTTLINGIKEQSERYLFTLNNSRLLNDFD